MKAKKRKICTKTQETGLEGKNIKTTLTFEILGYKHEIKTIEVHLLIAVKTCLQKTKLAICSNKHVETKKKNRIELDKR